MYDINHIFYIYHLIQSPQRLNAMIVITLSILQAGRMRLSKIRQLSQSPIASKYLELEASNSNSRLYSLIIVEWKSK